MILATHSKKLVAPMLAPSPHGSQMLVTRLITISDTNSTIACAVPLPCPPPITAAETMFEPSSTPA
jgi:hypothetical protein